jgi:hypothetical protein
MCCVRYGAMEWLSKAQSLRMRAFDKKPRPKARKVKADEKKAIADKASTLNGNNDNGER